VPVGGALLVGAAFSTLGLVVYGIVYVTEDRKVEGFFVSMSIAENIQLGKLASGPNPLEVVTKAQSRETAAEWTKGLGVRAIDPGPRHRALGREPAEGGDRKVADPEA
jgi:ABC-type sugar transport system ATPase subunit